VSGPTPSPCHPDGRVSLRVEDSEDDQLVAAARELEAHLLHEQARHLADVRALLADLYERDGVAVEDAMLDAQAKDVACQERGERFLHELATRLYPSTDLLELASRLDDYGLGRWQEAATSLVEVCRRRWRSCGGGWRRSSVPSCVATPTWSEPKPDFVPSGAGWGWRDGCGSAAGS
jgi:hypothetical protein